MQDDTYWLNVLNTAYNNLSSLICDDGWDSLIINKRKPHTYRMWKLLDDNVRVCLHKFDLCNSEEAFAHPHPWPGAFRVLKGQYIMKLLRSVDTESLPIEVSTIVLKNGSSYAITDPLTWHSVQPIEPCWSIMVNGLPFEKPHKFAPTTKGKGLEKMSNSELQDNLNIFKSFC